MATNFPAVAALLLACFVAEVLLRTADDTHLGKQNFLWKTGGWGSCYSPGGCGDGKRERPVWCSEPEGRTVLEFLCDPSTQPPRSKPCFTACRHHRDKLQWQVSAWGACLPVYPSSTSSVSERGLGRDSEQLGVMQRNVSCVLVAHDDMKVHREIDEDNCFTIARKPDPVKFCHIPVPQDCVVGEFSAWTACRGCDVANQTRVRSVIVAPQNGGKACPQLTETRPCNPKVECLTRAQPAGGSDLDKEYKLKVGEWRRCEAPTSMISADALYLSGGSSQSQVENLDDNYTFQPQVGYQTREVSCRDSKGAIVDLNLCLADGRILPARVRPCVVPQDCVVSQWSSWTRIQEGCIAGSGKVKPEIHQRKRDVVKMQQGEGQPCPHLMETRKITERDQLSMCSVKYKWLPSKWSNCVVTSDEPGARLVEVGCGGGVQLRHLTCVTFVGDQPVDPDLCSSLEPLPTVQRCEVACPRDCEVGEWGNWGPCRPMDCPQFGQPPAEGYRERHRPVVVVASQLGLECPAVREVQPCKDPACHSWTPGQWGSCQLDPGVIRCGEGRRTRTVTCKTLYGTTADDSFCERREQKPPTEEPCIIPCPYDCVLSPWSEWTPCSRGCSSPRKGASRQRNRTVIAPPGSGGHGCPDPDEMLQIESCNTHSCYGYSWMTLPWQPCVAENVSVEESSEDNEVITSEDVEEEESVLATNSGVGRQEREVWCMEANERRVTDSRCKPLNRPISSRACTPAKVQHCKVSPWSEWTPCPQQCIPDESNEVRDTGGEVTPTQTRHRVVIQPPSTGGRECPVLEELRPCPLSAARCRHHSWWIGDWSECQLPANVECGQGYRTRAVACQRNHHTKVDPSLCIQENGTIPHMSEPCHVSCDLPCIVSEWSTWSNCPHACSGKRKRQRNLIGLSVSRVECNNAGEFPLVEMKTCPCGMYVPKAEGDWSNCILEEPATTDFTANGRRTANMCGVGRRYRRKGCYDKDGNMVEPSLCSGAGLEEEPCMVPCPTDCLLSEWTTWSECSSSCGPGLQNRTREMIRPALNGGRPCFAQIEFKVCDTPCSQFEWVASGWMDCQLIHVDEQNGCGTGDQYRHVRCMRFLPHQLPFEVEDRYCDPVTQPADMNACHVACPGECVVSPWSDWSECNDPCDPKKERQRTRSVLRAPADPNANCPPLIEVQQCILNVTCFTYEWRATDWSSCIPLGGSPCGEGVQSRGIFCYRSDGRTVDNSFCKDMFKPTPSEKWCYVDCPVDCEVTEWTPWNTSECSCGRTGSVLRRQRYIVTNPSEMGRPCPPQLIHHKSCPAVPCYYWDRGPWRSCDLHGATCGHGTISRNVTCKREGGELVDEDLCLAQADVPFKDRGFLEVALDLRREDSCYVPCRGDCEVSEWSRWSHCHRNCQDGEMGGYQTRSRAVLKPPSQGGEPCPTALWETRPCFTGPCLTFDWVAKDGHVICERSDGVQVVGGCDGKPRPCVPACSADHAICTLDGQCICKEGYVAKFEPPPAGVSTSGNVQQAPQPILKSCEMTVENGSQDRTAASEAEIQSRYYYPKDDEISVWMFAMIGIGCVFIIFVAVSIYLMCHTSAGNVGGLQPHTLTIRQGAREGKP